MWGWRWRHHSLIGTVMYRFAPSEEVNIRHGGCLKSQARTSIRRDTQQWRVKPSAACSHIHNIYRLVVSRSVLKHPLSGGCTCVRGATNERVRRRLEGCYTERLRQKKSSISEDGADLPQTIVCHTYADCADVSCFAGGKQSKQFLTKSVADSR